MNTYVTGTTIKQLREARNMIQAELAERIGVSSKTISKWETAKGLPDITLLQPLAQALGISVIELMNGEQITNRNVSANMMRSKFYVCPLCGNVIHSTGNALVSCCGITLPALEAEDADDDHTVVVEQVEDEQFITIDHPMTKEHFISFVAHVNSDRLQMVKL
jgi:DNA-binding XRE family transcriptional regulator